MTATVWHLTTSRVAADGRTPALAWLARQRAWERRLVELERHATPTALRPPAGDLKRTA